MVDATDLATYLGVEVDDARAELLIGLASNLVGRYFGDGVPLGADAVILSATARAYSNPTGATAESVGPYQVSRPSAGVYLTKAERATLRRLATGGGAFSIDLVGINGANDATDYPGNRFPDWSTS